MPDFFSSLDTLFRPFLVIFATLIGLYLTFKKFGNSVSVTYTVEFKELVAPRISDVVLTNYKDKPVSIFSIIAVFDKDISLTLHDCKPPLILKPYETLSIETEPYSSLSINGDPYEPKFSDAEIFIETTNKLIKCRATKKSNIEQSYRRSMKKIRRFNGIIHSDLYKYLLVYRVDGELKTTFIHYSGYFENDWSFSFHSIKPKNKEIEGDEILKILKQEGLDHIFENYTLYEINQYGYEAIGKKGD